MTTNLNPYIGFRDNAREAMEHYRSIFGGELTVSTFAELGASDDPAEQDKVMHAQLTTDDGLTLMASDTPSSMPFEEGSRVSVSLSGEDVDRLRGYWEGLSAGGNVIMPFEPAPWGDVFGMCTDRYGVQWMVNAGSGSSS